MQESDLIFTGPAEEGMRIDKLLAERFPEYSRTYFQSLIEQGCVLLNGERVLKRIVPEEGDEIEICFQAIPGPSLTPESIPLDILYEDDHLLAINKPAGMVIPSCSRPLVRNLRQRSPGPLQRGKLRETTLYALGSSTA